MMEIKRKHPLAQCEVCPLYKSRCAQTTGPEDAPVAVVSRSPGKHDVMYGKPFSGPSGKVLDYLLKMYGVKRNEIITTNVVLCQSDDPPKEAIAACRPRLESEIANSELVIAAGTEATSALTRYRAVFTGRPFVHHRTTSTGIKQRVIVTNNPAVVIRDSDTFPNMVEDFRRAFDPPPPPVFPEVEIIDDPNNAINILERWIGSISGPTSSDLEWFGNNIVCAGFASRGSKAVVFGFEACRDSNVRERLRKLYTSDGPQYIWHNGKADTTVLWNNGIEGRIDEDTYLMSIAIDERPGYHSLEYLLSTKFGWPDYEPQTVKNFKKLKTEAEFEEWYANRLNRKELYKYNGWDTAGTYQLFQTLDPKLDTDKGGSVRDLYKHRLLPAATAFRTVERNGIHFDAEEACNLSEAHAIPRLFELTDHIREITGHGLLNPRSPTQIKAVVYDEFGLKHNLRDSGKKKLSTSTGKEVREEIEAGRFQCKVGKTANGLAYKEALVRWASAQRQYSKIDRIRGNYLEGLAIRSRDGKVYGHFNLGGTVSGRVSSNDPNLQNIAREGYEEIPGIRTLFLPSPGNVIISADFSQAELRTCAKLSGDTNFLGIYRDSSRSLHKERAAAFYGANYTKEEYVKSKNQNFGITYGQSASAFQQMYHIPMEESQAYIDSWWNDFPTLLEWTNEIKQRARADGLIQSPFGHKRRFHLITDDNVGDVEREAVNFLPQNIAAWFTISALVELVNMGIRIVATVHDSIVADVPANEAFRVARTMKEVMERQPVEQFSWDDIPFLADISIGPNWGAVEEVELKVAA